MSPVTSIRVISTSSLLRLIRSSDRLGTGPRDPIASHLLSTSWMLLGWSVPQLADTSVADCCCSSSFRGGLLTVATTASCLQVAGTVVIPSNDVINIGCFYLTAGEAELADPTVPFEDGCSDTGPVTRQPILAVAGLPCHVTPIGREWTGVSTPDHQGVSWGGHAQ